MRNIKFFIGVLLVALIGLAVNVAAAEHVLNPVADAFVRDGEHDQNNYGSDPVLELKWDANGPGFTRITFITFDIENINSVERAKIRLFAEWVDVLEVRELVVFDVTGFEWVEEELTWNDVSFEDGTIIGYLDVPNIEKIWHEIDVTDQLKEHVASGASTFTVRIENLSDHWGGLVRFSSKEGADAPELVIID